MAAAQDIIRWDAKRRRWVLKRGDLTIASSVNRSVMRRRFPTAKVVKKK